MMGTVSCLSRRLVGAVLLALFATLASAGPAGDETPIGPKWWPSEWGADGATGSPGNPIAVR